MPISLDYIRGALDYKSRHDEIRVAFPTQKTIYEDELHIDSGALSMEEWLAEFERHKVVIPAYMQIIGLASNRPGFVVIAPPDHMHRRKYIMGGSGMLGTFSLDDLTLLPYEDDRPEYNA